MSRKNSLAVKQQRRAERELNAVRVEKKRALQARINYLFMAPPDTFDDLEAEIDKAITEANED